MGSSTPPDNIPSLFCSGSEIEARFPLEGTLRVDIQCLYPIFIIAIFGKTDSWIGVLSLRAISAARTVDRILSTSSVLHPILVKTNVMVKVIDELTMILELKGFPWQLVDHMDLLTVVCLGFVATVDRVCGLIPYITKASQGNIGFGVDDIQTTVMQLMNTVRQGAHRSNLDLRFGGADLY